MTRTSMSYGRYFATENDIIFGDLPSWLGEQPAGVVYCHGSGDDALIAYSEAGQNKIMRGAAHTATVHCGDLGYEAWGNNTHIARIASAVTYLRSTWGQDGPVVLVGSSMGALGALAYTLANPTDVAAVAVAIPALDLQDLLSRGAAAAINAAYGGTYNNGTDGPTHSPVLFADDLPADLPIKMWTCSDDTVCVPATADAFMTSRSQTVRVNLGALGHSDAAIEAAADSIVEFVATHTAG